jgi:hypothetical protein
LGFYSSLDAVSHPQFVFFAPGDFHIMTRRRTYRSNRDYDYRDRDSQYRSRRRYSYNNRRSRRTSERQVEVITFGLVVLLFLAQLSFRGAFTTPVILILGAVVLLGSAIYQSQRRWRVNPMTWIGGASMLIFGVLALQSGQVAFGLGPLLPLGIFAAVLVASFVSGEF